MAPGVGRQRDAGVARGRAQLLLEGDEPPLRDGAPAQPQRLRPGAHGLVLTGEPVKRVVAYGGPDASLVRHRIPPERSLPRERGHHEKRRRYAPPGQFFDPDRNRSPVRVVECDRHPRPTPGRCRGKNFVQRHDGMTAEQVLDLAHERSARKVQRSVAEARAVIRHDIVIRQHERATDQSGPAQRGAATPHQSGLEQRPNGCSDAHREGELIPPARGKAPPGPQTPGRAGGGEPAAAAETTRLNPRHIPRSAYR